MNELFDKTLSCWLGLDYRITGKEFTVLKPGDIDSYEVSLWEFSLISTDYY